MNELMIIASLVVMEGILSLDNAAVLATMVRHLPPEEQKKALKYGILGAYVFRLVALALAVYIVQFTIFKFLGGAYLIYLAYSHFTKPSHDESGASAVGKSFWMTVVSVEVMDLIFSIDNVLAAVALSPKFWVVAVGVVIGITVMRFAAGGFLTLLNKYPGLENAAFMVICMLGVKLVLPSIFTWIGFHAGEAFLHGHTASIVTSILTIGIFGYPILKSYFKSI